jgi:hypothetical protein
LFRFPFVATNPLMFFLTEEYGTCTPVRACRGAINEIQKGMRPVICSFDSINEPIICCAVTNQQIRISMRSIIKIK